MIPLILKIFFPVGLIGCLIVLGGALAEFFYLRPNMHKLTQTLHALQPKLQSSTYTLLRWMRPSDFPRIDLRSLHLDE